MHILTFTTLFPNELHPNLGIFVRSRMEAYKKRYGPEWTVVAPVPYFPKIPFRSSGKYHKLARVPLLETSRGYSVHHPRYLIAPKIGMRWYGHSLAIGAIKTIERIHLQKNIDLIDAHYVYPDGFAASIVANRLKIPLTISARGSDLVVYRNIPSILDRLSYAIRSCDSFIGVSKQLSEIARDLAPEQRFNYTIRNGIDLERFSLKDRTNARRILNIELDKKVFLSVGNLVPLKGFDLLIRAIAAIKDKEASLYILGTGPLGQSLSRLSMQLGVAEQIHLMGHIPNEELQTWYAAADYFIMASQSEGSPNAVCEALGMGLPIIGTDIPSIREIVVSDALGIVAEERTEAGLAKCMQLALEKTWDKDTILSVGRSRSWDHVADELHQVFINSLQR